MIVSIKVQKRYIAKGFDSETNAEFIRFFNYGIYTEFSSSSFKDFFKQFLIFIIHVTTKTNKDDFFNGLVVFKEEFRFS